MDHLLWFPLIACLMLAILVQENLALTEEQVSRIIVIVFANVFVVVFANAFVFVVVFANVFVIVFFIVFGFVFVCHIWKTTFNLTFRWTRCWRQPTTKTRAGTT